jgi:hypothetical protein
MPWQVNFMFLRIGCPMGHTDIFPNLLVYFMLSVAGVGISRIGEERHLCHFGNCNCWKMIVHFHISQKQVTATNIEWIFFKTFCKMGAVKIRSLMINPGSKIHGSHFSRNVLSGNERKGRIAC